MAKEVREKFYHRAILAIFLEICQKKPYCESLEYFLKFLQLLKLITKDNQLLHENKTGAYEFVLSHFDSFMSRSCMDIDSACKILKQLLDIALGTNFDIKRMDQKLFIGDKAAMNAYFQILVRCFKELNAESNKHLKAYVIAPLEALTKSFINNCILSNILVQDLLIKILKRSKDRDFQKQITRQLGVISSTNTTAKHIHSLMRSFMKKPKYISKEKEEEYFISMLYTLIDCISGDNIRDIYFFSGKEDSFIELKTPLKFPSAGLFWTGYIRYEGKNANKKQCIFSFTNQKPVKQNKVELYIEDRKLVYCLEKISYSGKSSKVIHKSETILSCIKLIEDSWHRITMMHIGNDLITTMNTSLSVITLSSEALAKTYTEALIGINKNNGELKFPLFGEISALHFFNPTPYFQDRIRESSSQREQGWAKHIVKELLSSLSSSSGQAQITEHVKDNTNRIAATKFDIANTVFIVDPKVISLITFSLIY